MSTSRIAVSLLVFSSLLIFGGQAAAWSLPLHRLVYKYDEAIYPQKAATDKAQSQAQRAEKVKLIYKVEAIYPQEAKEQGVEGKVILEFTINKKGDLIDARVKEGPELLRKAALAALRQSRFSNPRKQKVQGTLTYDFRLDKDKQKPGSPSASQTEPKQAVEEAEIKLIKRVEPIYPQEAEDQGITGTVIVEITIDEKGEVAEAKVQEGPELLHQAALDAVKQWRFSNPAKKRVVATIGFKFEN